jgi:hypothetical protein
VTITPDQARSSYRRYLTHTVAIRRYTGPAGPNRASVDTPCRARLRGAAAGVLVGDVMQFNFLAIILVEDLVAGGFALPITTGDKLVFGTRELAINFPDNATRSVDGELIAYVLSAKG